MSGRWSPHNSRLQRPNQPTMSTSPKMQQLVETLQAMGFEENACVSALKKARGNIETAANILARGSSDSSSRPPEPVEPEHLPPPPFSVHEENVELQPGCFVDCRDKYGMWLEAEVLQRKGDKVKIHFCGWDHKWDEVMTTLDPTLFAPFHRLSVHGSQSKYKVNDRVCIWSPRGVRKWKLGSVSDLKHHQVCVKFRGTGPKGKPKICTYWYHYHSPDIVHEKEFNEYQEKLRANLTDTDAKKPSENGPPEEDEGNCEWFKDQMLEVKDTYDKWCLARLRNVTKLKNGGYILFVTYEDYGPEWDERLNTNNRADLSRIRKVGAALKETNEEKTKRIAEEKFRKHMQDKHGYKIVDIEKDGNCMFRSFGHQIFGDMKRHEEVRKLVCDHMEKHRDHFENLWNFYPTVDNVKDFDAYLIKMRKPSEWGDQLMLLALSELFNKNVEIYDSEKVIDMGTGLEELKTVRLSYHGKNHYNSVVDEKDPPPYGDGKGDKVSILEKRLKQNSQSAANTSASEGETTSTEKEEDTSSKESGVNSKK